MSAQKKSFLRHIQNLNAWNPDHFRSFYMSGVKVGYLREFMCQELNRWPQYFKFAEDKVEFIDDTGDFTKRNQLLDDIIIQLVEQGVISHYLGEPYPVTGTSRDQELAIIDRGAAAYFGIKAYGQHLNGYVKTGDSLKLWVARRAADRIHFPNKLDNIVAGGLPQNLSLQQNLLKECHEEANIPADLVMTAKATGAITYCCETEKGLKPDTLYCYDLELPASFQPVNTDGEVAEFQLMNLQDVMTLVSETDEFKQNCNLVIIDFMIRHGVIPPEEKGYLEIISGLHPST